MSSTIGDDRRDQILNDSSFVSQYAFPWNSKICYLTRPMYVPSESADSTVVLGSASDVIGSVFPVVIPKAAFQGFFTSLVRKDDAEEFKLAVHPKAPDTVRGPSPEGVDPPQPVPASADRLQFPMESDEECHSPVIAALPLFLPIPPGYTFPEGTPIDSPRDQFRADFRLFEVWLQALRYARAHNDFQSVTEDGPLFLLNDLTASPNPFQALQVVAELLINPVPSSPFTSLNSRCTTMLHSWADDTWVTLGMQSDPLPRSPPRALDPSGTEDPPPPATVTPPLTAKEKAQARTAATVAAGYRLAFACLPSPDAADVRHAILPSLPSDFQAVLDSPKPQDACVELRQILTGKIAEANASDLAMLRDVTLEPHLCTLSLSNCIRSFHWLDLPLVSTNKHSMESMLGILHFLTPDQQALLAQVSREVTTGPVVLSHVADDKAQLEASTKSRLYTRGRLQTGRDLYHAVCNFSLMADLLVTDGSSSMLVSKLKRYANALNSADGRRFLQTYQNHPFLPIHLFQDIQHIVTLYFRVAQSHKLRTQVLSQQPISVANYTAISRAADLVVDHLNNVLLGGGLGRYEAQPHTFPWFRGEISLSPRQSSLPNPHRPADHPDGPPSKRQRPAPAAAMDPERVERAKSSGLLVFDPQAAGSKDLPLCPIRDTRPGSKTPERCCMSFMTRGYHCSEPTCPRPHVSNLRRFSSDKKREDFIRFVTKTPGLSWSPGNAPPGKGPSS